MFDRALNTPLALFFFILWFFVISLKSMEIGALNKQGDGLENNQKQKIKLYQNYEEIRLGRCCQKKIRSDNATVYRYSVNLPTRSCLSNFYAQHSSSTGMKHKEIEKIRRKTEESSRKTEESSRKTEESSTKTEESSRKTEESSRQTEESLVSFEY